MEKYDLCKNKQQNSRKTTGRIFSVGGRQIRLLLLIQVLLSACLLAQVRLEESFPLYKGSLRFHIRAHSDLQEDQELKRLVRDAVLAGIREETENAASADDLFYILKKQRKRIAEDAVSCLREHGCRQKVKVSFTRERFPVKCYGSIIFPAGVYRAMRVDIGSAKGHNWWCALFPDLCYNKKDYVVSEKGKQDIKKIFLPEEPAGGAAGQCGPKTGSTIAGKAMGLVPESTSREGKNYGK